MESVNWGGLYDRFHDEVLDTAKQEEEISKLIKDSDVTKKSGVYYYVLTHEGKTVGIVAERAGVRIKNCARIWGFEGSVPARLCWI